MTDPVLRQRTHDGGNAYVHPITGDEYPSTTSILRVLNKPALVGWASKVAAEYAVDRRDTWLPMLDGNQDSPEVRRQRAIDTIKSESRRSRNHAANVGSTVHHLAERIADGETVTLDGIARELRPFVRAFFGFLGACQPHYVLTEQTVFSHTHRYAGTLDAVVETTCDMRAGKVGIPAGSRLLLDIKTGKGVYPETALQLASYRYADEVIDGPPWSTRDMPLVDYSVVLHLRPDHWRVVLLNTDRQVFEAFLTCARMDEFQRSSFKSLVGPAIEPVQVAS